MKDHLIYRIFCPVKMGTTKVINCIRCKELCECETFRFRVRYIDRYYYFRKKYISYKKIEFSVFRELVDNLNKSYIRQMKWFKDKFSGFFDLRDDTAKLFQLAIALLKPYAQPNIW